MREFSYMRFVFALFDFMRAHCIGCIGEEGFLNVENTWWVFLSHGVKISKQVMWV